MLAESISPAAALAEAADPTTLPERLGQLLDTRDRAVLYAVARNPNTPIALLLLLLQFVPEHVTANPLLPLLSLQDPTWPSMDDPIASPERLALGEGVRALVELFGDKMEIYQHEFDRFEHLAPWLLEVLSDHPDPQVRLDLAHDFSEHKGLLDKLALDSDPRVRAEATRSRKT